MRPDEIAALLRRAVRERVLLPGQTLNQDELAKRFGVSRIPLREALRTLVGEGLIVIFFRNHGLSLCFFVFVHGELQRSNFIV
jgi:DNA-binding GntR family transcriptional regulator